MDLPLGLIIARWFFFSSTMVAFGSCLFPWYAFSRSTPNGVLLTRWTLTSLVATSFVALVCWLLILAGTLDSDQPLLATTKTLLLATGFGPAWTARLVLGAAALIAALLYRRNLVLMVCFGLLASEGWDGHAVAHGSAGSLNQAIHVVFAGAWIGGLIPLVRLVKNRAQIGSQVTISALYRFSRFAVVIVALLAVTGMINAYYVLGGSWYPTGLYARMLLLKISLLVVMVAIAAINRFWIVARLNGSDALASARLLTTMIVIEQVLGLCVLLDVSWLGLMNPLS